MLMHSLTQRKTSEFKHTYFSIKWICFFILGGGAVLKIKKAIKFELINKLLLLVFKMSFLNGNCSFVMCKHTKIEVRNGVF